MKLFKGFSTILLAITFVLSPLGTISVSAAGVAPDLGAAATYAVFGKTGVTNDLSVTTHIWGNVGADAVNVTNLDDATQVDGVIDAGAGVEAAILTAYGALNAQAADGVQNLSGVVTVTPGVYTVGAALLNGTVTLDGAGVYIFRSDSSITVDPGAEVVMINGADACNVFWQVPTAMTIGAGAELVGTIITNTALISFGDSATLEGRALSRNAQVTLIRNQITEPICAVASTSGGTTKYGTINVVKTVINDNGGTKTVADFPLFINGGFIASGITNRFGTSNIVTYDYTVTETTDPQYTQTFSGDCDSNGIVTLNPDEAKFCIITNDDIGAPTAIPPVPPIIDVVKVPSPLSLPNGPGAVTYTYTLRNIGTVPVTDITMVGDTCSPINLATGDTNGDAKLDLNETWVYTCSTILSETHTNTIVATGWANGISATDIASARVVVGLPIIPPLIHVTKSPSPLTLPAGGGMVTYTEKITNPGAVALSNVRLTDDKCSPMKYISGDTNNDAKLDTTETWTYTCSTKLVKTTTNTAVAVGEANGLTVRDFALATVVVASVVPSLPNTGTSAGGTLLWSIIIATGFLVLSSVALTAVLRKNQLNN
ncbi:MAG: Outer membrane autotransporter barrel [Candidatus Falkowbacteria bacterium GW2011_GWF2_43_32]|nr:MAG: Outer membrane autotransporter barrel [Candidatus Falkowbacteria bacterium GW2011_GWF2_43_32]